MDDGCGLLGQNHQSNRSNKASTHTPSNHWRDKFRGRAVDCESGMATIAYVRSLNDMGYQSLCKGSLPAIYLSYALLNV